jgi:hypothetical protein
MEVVHQTAMYYQDRLAGKGFARVLLGGTGATTLEVARHNMEHRLGLAVEKIDTARIAPLDGSNLGAGGSGWPARAGRRHPAAHAQRGGGRLMLRTNLSTRPFYNVRAVQATLALVTAVVVAITLFNVVQYARLSALERSLGADALRAETEAARLRGEAARLRAQINPKELELVATAAREANTVIDQRASRGRSCSPQFEQTLPEGRSHHRGAAASGTRRTLMVAIQIRHDASRTPMRSSRRSKDVARFTTCCRPRSRPRRAA